MGKRIRFISALVLLVVVCSFVGFSSSGEDSNWSDDTGTLRVTLIGTGCTASDIDVNAYDDKDVEYQLLRTTGCTFEAVVPVGDYIINACGQSVHGTTEQTIKDRDEISSGDIDLDGGQCTGGI